MSDNKLQDQGEGFYRGQGYMGKEVHVFERPTDWLDQHNASALRGQARAVDIASRAPRAKRSNQI